MRQQSIIGTQQQQILTRSPMDSLIESFDVSLVGRMSTIRDPRILTRQMGSDLVGVVARSVIDYQNSYADTVLMQDAFDALGQIATVVVAWYDNVHAALLVFALL
jgi:hypothetical protein